MLQGRDETPPLELVKQVPKGELHSPYPDYAKLAITSADLDQTIRDRFQELTHGLRPRAWCRWSRPAFLTRW